MSGKTQSPVRRRIGPLLTAGTVGALVLAGATACASSTKTVGSSDTSSVPVATVSTSPTTNGGATASASATATASGSASAGSTASNHPFIPSTGGIVVTPQAQVSTLPTGKLTGFDSAAHSADGRTLYLGLESQGGACGQYDVVLQQSSGSVSVGLVHLSAGGRICPMYVAHMLVSAKLSAPLDGRKVVDLANGQVVASPQIS